jgi:inner membrane protein
VVGGVAVGLLLTPIIGPEQIPGLLIGAILGSLLPDLDTPRSRLSNLQLAGVRPFQLPAQFLCVTLGHRGALHSLVGALLVCGVLSVPLVAIGQWGLALGLLLGFLSHLLLDGLTKSGVPLFWPTRGRSHLLPTPLRFTAGTLAEEAFFTLLACAALWLLMRLALTTAPTSSL